MMNNGKAISNENPLPTKSSANNAMDVVPNDAGSLVATKGIYLGGSGDLRVILADGGIVTFVAMSAGMIHPLSVTRVLATGTTATNIIAVY